MFTVPNKTIYVSDGDLPIYQRAQELAGDNLSAGDRRCPPPLRRRRGGPARGLRRDHRPRRARQGPQGPLHRRPPRRVGQLDVEPRTRPSGSTAAGPASSSLHVERSAGLHDGRRRGQAGRLARLPRASATSATAARPASRPSRSSTRSTSFASGSRPSSTTWSPARPASRPSRTSTSDPRLVGADASGRCGMTAAGRPVGDPRRPGCASRTASRSSSTASTSRSPRARSSPCSARTAPARRRPSRSSRR